MVEREVGGRCAEESSEPSRLKMMGWCRGAVVAWATCMAGLAASHQVQAQGATGIGCYLRGAGDAIGTTRGWTVQSGYLQFDSAASGVGQWVRFGASISQAIDVHGMSQMPARDTAAGIPDAVVPYRQRLRDGGLFAEFGVALPARKRGASWVMFGGLRVLVRTFQLSYGGVYDAELYDEGRGRRTPFIPGALNIGFTLGTGVVVESGPWQLQPYLTLGSGAPDRRQSSPWNAYPAYVEGGVVVLRAHR